jgi:hypothetical protein
MRAMRVGSDGLPPRIAVQQMVTSYWISQAVRTMAALNLADQLSSGPRSVDDLAAATSTHLPTLARLLRTLTALGLCATNDEGQVALTPAGELLRSDVPGSMRPFALAIAAPHMTRAWEGLPQAVQTGEATFASVHGIGFWDYLTDQPEEGALFDGAMTGVAGMRGQALLAVRDLSEISTVVDVGGGQGQLLSPILNAVPGLRGVVFDRPEVAEGARAAIQAAGLAERCTFVGGDFFTMVPSGAEGYILAQVLHDWPDEEATQILQVCHRAMAPGARIWLIEQVVPPGDDLDWSKLIDLHMLVLFGAKERTGDEYHALLEAAGFGDVSVLSTPTPWSVVEAVRQ